MIRYIIFGHGRYFVTTNALGGFIYQKKQNKKDGFGFVEFSERKIEVLKRLGLKEF